MDKAPAVIGWGFCRSGESLFCARIAVRVKNATLPSAGFFFGHLDLIFLVSGPSIRCPR